MFTTSPDLRLHDQSHGDFHKRFHVRPLSPVDVVDDLSESPVHLLGQRPLRHVHFDVELADVLSQLGHVAVQLGDASL